MQWRKKNNKKRRWSVCENSQSLFRTRSCSSKCIKSFIQLHVTICVFFTFEISTRITIIHECYNLYQSVALELRMETFRWTLHIVFFYRLQCLKRCTRRNIVCINGKYIHGQFRRQIVRFIPATVSLSIGEKNTFVWKWALRKHHLRGAALFLYNLWTTVQILKIFPPPNSACDQMSNFSTWWFYSMICILCFSFLCFDWFIAINASNARLNKKN